MQISQMKTSVNICLRGAPLPVHH